MRSNAAISACAAVAAATLRSAAATAGVVQCGSREQLRAGGCTGPPQWPVRWDMASSTYMYCFGSCQLDWLANHTDLGLWGGVVGVDHYWTHQGMPCVGGVPQEFEMQNAFTNATKAVFPRARVLQYRITSAVPYAAVVHDKILSDPDYFVRWSNGSVCQMWYEENGTHGQNCSWQIRASSYDWTNPAVTPWFINTIIAPTLAYADGAWIDGDGPDNGAYGCSGQWNYGTLPAPYPALDPTQIAAYCQAEAAGQAAAQQYLLSHGGMDYNCFTFIGDNHTLPVPGDSAATCASKLAALDHRPSPTGSTVLYGDRTDSKLYSDEWAAQAVAVFLLVRDEYWWFGFPNYSGNSVNASTAALMLSDYGPPLGNMTASSTQPGVFTRQYSKATVSLDCNTFTASFTTAV